jgi:hypothetical protein
MSTTYAGVADEAPATLTIPTTCDPAAMTILAAALEGLADRTAICIVAQGYQTLSDALLYTATRAGVGLDDGRRARLTLPAGILATDIIEVEADFEGESAGANDVVVRDRLQGCERRR